MSNVLGIDVSKYQDNNATPQRVNWTKAKAAGAKFAFIKLGQGTWVDEDFQYNWRESKLAGIMRGAYWYLDNNYGISGQARLFMNTLLGTNDMGELPPVADFEMRTNVPAPPQARQRLRTFLSYVEQVDHRIPILYVAPAYWSEQGSNEISWRRYPLWIANYGVTSPAIPAPWNTWTFWQYTATGPGLEFGMESLGLDMDLYHQGQGFDSIIIPQELTDKQKLDKLWDAHPELH